MKIIPFITLLKYEGRIINIHSTYLPEFPGPMGLKMPGKLTSREWVTVTGSTVVLIQVKLLNKSVNVPRVG